MAHDAEAFQRLFSVDLRTLPDGVIRAMYIALRDETNRRRQRVAAQAKEEQATASDIEKRFRGLPSPHHEFNHHAFRYLPELLNQDWTHLYAGGDPEPIYYVYAHAYPKGKGLRFVHDGLKIGTNGWPFYIGKGCGDRAYDLVRNQGHGETLRQLLRDGHKPGEIVHILRTGLTEAKALEIESKLIYFFGTKYEAGRRGILVNLDIPPRPEMERNDGRQLASARLAANDERSSKKVGGGVRPD